MNREQNDLARRYEEYQQQTGNLYATGYALATEDARAALHATVLRLWRALGGARRQAVRSPVTHRAGATLAPSKTIAR